jgi:formylmethanofuran dehydrogenase subunit C
MPLMQTPVLQIEGCGESCLCDFTFDFYWQHQGTRLSPDKAIGGVTLRHLVQALSKGDTVKIRGDVGSRLGSSLGVDLIRLGGRGGPIEATGKILVDGDVGSRMGISMLRGAIYVSGRVEPPLGNVAEVQTDLSGFRKFISLTEILERSIPVMKPNYLEKDVLTNCDGILRDTAGARNHAEKTIRLGQDAGMSTGILMRSGQIDIVGDAGWNTGVLQQGGRIVVRGKTGDFTGAEMRGGEVYVGTDAGSFACARMKGGAVYARQGKPVPPARMHQLSSTEQAKVAGALGLSSFYAMMYRRLGL